MVRYRLQHKGGGTNSVFVNGGLRVRIRDKRREKTEKKRKTARGTQKEKANGRATSYTGSFKESCKL